MTGPAHISALVLCRKCKGAGEIPGRVAVIALGGGGGFFRPSEGMIVCPRCDGRGIDPASYECCGEVEEHNDAIL
jgi:hypothetical protein